MIDFIPGANERLALKIAMTIENDKMGLKFNNGGEGVGPIPSAALVVRNPGLVEAEIDGEVVALNIENGNCYGLNSIGSRVWGLITRPISTDEICNSLTAEYEVAPDICKAQVLDLLSALRAEGMITIQSDR